MVATTKTDVTCGEISTPTTDMKETKMADPGVEVVVEGPTRGGQTIVKPTEVDSELDNSFYNCNNKGRGASITKTGDTH